MENQDSVKGIRELVANIFLDNKIELVSLTYKREGSARVLRILADTESGITADECSKLNEMVGTALDEANIIAEKYVLEISSPGLDRPLKRRRDFERIKGKKIYVHTFAPINEKKEFAGALHEIDDSGIGVMDDGAKLTKIPFDKISKATLDYKSLI